MARPAAGRGFFNWLGCHWIDLISCLTGDRIAAVTARGWLLRRNAH